MKHDPTTVDMIDVLIRKAKASQAADIDANLCQTSSDFRKAEEAESELDTARRSLLVHLNVEDC